MLGLEALLKLEEKWEKEGTFGAGAAPAPSSPRAPVIERRQGGFQDLLVSCQDS